MQYESIYQVQFVSQHPGKLVKLRHWVLISKTSSSAMTERLRYACSSTVMTMFRAWVILRLNFRLKGCVSRQYLWTVRWENGYITTLLLEDFTQRNFVADFIHFI